MRHHRRPGFTGTLNFSSAVSGIVFSEVSLGQPGIATQYTFDKGFNIEACGPNAVFGDGCITQSGGTMLGHESDVTILFPVVQLPSSPLLPKILNSGMASPSASLRDLPLHRQSRSLIPWLWLARAF